MLREAQNRVKIEGILSEVDLKYSTFVKNGETVEAIGGTIKVLVEQEINGKYEVTEPTIHMFSSKYTKKGTVNPAYESIEKVMKEFVSIASSSKELADRIRITNAQIVSNDFYGQNGQIVSQPRIKASFVSRAIGDFEPQATFELEFMLSSMNRMVDNEGVELDPAKLCIEAIIPQYGAKVDVVKLYASNPNVVNAIESYWEPGNSYKASGRLNFSSSTQTVLEEVDFGEPIKKVKTVSVSELLVTGGTQAPLDEDFAFALDDIRTAMAERKARLEAQRDKGSQRTAPVKTQKGKLDLGF